MSFPNWQLLKSMNKCEDVVLRWSLFLLILLILCLVGFGVSHAIDGVSELIILVFIALAFLFSIAAIVLWVFGWIRLISAWRNRTSVDNMVYLILLIVFGPLAAGYVIYGKK